MRFASRSRNPHPSPAKSTYDTDLSDDWDATSQSLIQRAIMLTTLTPPIFPRTRSNSKAHQLHLRSGTRKSSPMRIASRSRSSQRSSGRRMLGDSSDNGNGSPRSSSGSSDDVENRVFQTTTPVKDVGSEDFYKFGVDGCSENSYAPHRALASLDKSDRSPGSFIAKSSPLKRSDGIMNLDFASPGSPSAKRRSIHGSAFGTGFDIFSSETASDAQAEQRNVRAPPLRRTMQQRYDKPALSRSKLYKDSGVDSVGPKRAVSNEKPRLSLDNLPSAMSRESPFSTPSSLENASIHPLAPQKDKPFSIPAQPNRHPLSRTITQSSSSSGLTEDSPTHAPIRHPENRRGIVDFSRSVPAGAKRPGSRESVESKPAAQGSSVVASVSTPDYRLAKPLPQAFMSTGLISKKHKVIDESPQPEFYGGRSVMPDTPCKRHSVMGAAAPPMAPDIAEGRTRHTRHSFGTPSTPFSPHPARAAPATFGKGVSIFGSNFKGNGVNRRGSFLSNDGDDHTTSPPGKLDSQSSNECELPPTPTKQAVASYYERFEPTANLEHQEESSEELVAPIRAGIRPPLFNSSSKLQLSLPIPSTCADGAKECDADQSSSSVASRFRSYSSMPSSFTSARFLRNNKAPSPLLDISYNSSSLQSIRNKAKPSPLSPASPLSERVEPFSPHTPRDNMAPPDPSGLSISARAEGQPFKRVNDVSSSASFPPATPTASRDCFVAWGRSSLNSSYTTTALEIDQSLKSKFDKVELVGTGEFAHVYRVTQAQSSKDSDSWLSLKSAQSSPRTSRPDRVWAVKKTRQEYKGPKDRQRILQEVVALKTLGKSDHTVQLIDSWEDNNRLYIQTEFCEEGSLDIFLGNVGRKARLDDFRIWKILLELSQGLKHVHDSGYIHLDLKPANVLITFEGCLKIGDFGLATPWPAPPGIDGEGDREYIGPEILKGQFDKPSDIFALGLIMLEIAGNVMLPENGASWQRLRSGDMSDVPSLTWSSETSILRNSSGKPILHEVPTEEFYGADSGGEEFGSPNILCGRRKERKQHGAQFLRAGELAEPPVFMVDANHPEAMDKLVRWMISPDSADRPTVDQLLAAFGVRWVDGRKRAGATVYEGNWGPSDEVLGVDTEMTDV